MLRKISFFYWFAIVSATAQNYSVIGNVKDATTGEKLPFVSVYVNNTTKGTSTDNAGNFKINNISLSKFELVASMIGYTNFRQTIEVKDGKPISLEISLVPATEALKEVTIKTNKDKKWERQLNRFLKEFWGESGFRKNCVLKNAFVLDFSFSERNDELTASATAPLEIENQALGYKIFFDLKTFSTSPAKTIINGLTRYQNLENAEESTQKKWQRNRLKAYFGSERHLLTALYNKKWEAEGFTIYRVNPSFYSPNNVYHSIDEQLGKRLLTFDSTNFQVSSGKNPASKKIALPAEIEILYTKGYDELSYRDAKYPVSWISTTQALEIFKNGIVSNASAMQSAGDMANRRVAEMLPLDYQPEGETEGNAVPANSPNANAYLTYQEIPYLHLNKPYYFAGENIWFKAYMFYKNEAFKDSLSNVLYVDLIAPNNEIIQKRILKLNNGVAWGDFSLPKNVPNSTYRIRAYTAWMMNFGENILEEKQFPVIQPTQKMAASETHKASENKTFGLKLDKDFYQPKEKITLTISSKDGDKILPAHLSVSVVDVEAIPSFRSEKQNILSFTPPFSAIFKQIIPFAEDALHFSGYVINQKNVPTKANLVILNKQTNQILTAESDSLGKFFVGGYNFSDSLVVAIQASDDKGKAIEGTILLDKSFVPPVRTTFKPLKFELVLQDSVKTDESFALDKNSKLLNEVTIKARKQVGEETREFLDRTNKIYGNPDFSIKSEQFRDASATAPNILVLLQGRVPGLKVVETIRDGQPRYIVKIRAAQSSSFFSNSTDPLFLVDGIPMENADQFLAIPVSSVERVDVLKNVATTAMFGMRGYNGVIAVYTKGNSKDLFKNTNFTTENGYKDVTLIGYSSPRNFPSPVANESDLRTTIYWNPNVETNENGEASVSFTAADKATTYKIIIEGITKDGKVGRLERMIEIKK